MRTIDLFAGIGGMRLGFEKAGFETVFANDFEPKCADTYNSNFDSAQLVVKDIRKIKSKDLPSFDFLLGGFPCQAFSVAGHRKGFSDKRGILFLEIARILKEKKPLGFLLENVKNLKNHDNKQTFKIIRETLNDAGYDIETRVLNSAEYGNVPQNRERIYIVGFKKSSGLIKKFNFPESIRRDLVVSDILENPKKIEQKYYYNDKPLFERMKDFLFETGVVYQWRRKYIRENKSGLCPTLTANMGTGGHNVPIIKDERGIRKITPRECARLQGFPDSYKLPNIADSHLYKQLGNSVSVPVIERIATNIKLITEEKTLSKISQPKSNLKKISLN